MPSADDVTRGTPARDSLGADDAFTRTTPASNTAPPTADFPPRIGPYRCIRAVGRGGMGTVLLAIREEAQFKHRVAIKLLRQGMDTADILRRFELERQVLAALNHANIARLLDAGASEDGRPYFVMEYVEGRPIDEYCDTEGLSVAERLRLFRKVCAAVQFAHQNLVVHRDLKPGNILVGADGEPKLVDFGIAKLLNPDLAQITVATGPELRLMTPEYASPEQVQGLPVSTVSDVYSLGVLLYELLSGHRPYRFVTRVQQEVVRVVCEVEPERPSTAVARVEDVPRRDGTTCHLTPETVAKTRGEPPQKLRRRLSGDLDNIVLKAMQKVPRRRYASVEQLSADLQRHIDGLPVLARPDSRMYRFSKFVRRNRVGVAAVLAIVVALSVGVLGTSWQWRNAERARAQADQARALAEHRTQQFSRLVDGFVEELRGKIHRTEGATAARKLLAATAVDAAERLQEEGADDPQVLRKLAEVYLLAGDVLGGIRTGSEGATDSALDFHRRALEILEPLVSADPEHDGLRCDLARSHTRVADGLRENNEVGAALGHYQTAVDLTRTTIARAPRNPQAARLLASALDGWGDMLLNQGASAEALERYEEAAEVRARLLRASPRDIDLRRALSVSYGKLGKTLAEAGNSAEALEQYTMALAMRQKLVEQSPDVRAKRDLMNTHERMGELLRSSQRADEGEKHVAEALLLASELHEADPLDMRALMDLARVETSEGELRLAQKQPIEAAAAYQRAVTHAEAVTKNGGGGGEGRYRLAQAQAGLGRALAESDPRAGLERCRIALDLYRELLEADWSTALVAERLAATTADCAAACQVLGDRAAALDYYQQAIEALEELAERGALRPELKLRLEEMRARHTEMLADSR